jgi:hypothetical protein
MSRKTLWFVVVMLAMGAAISWLHAQAPAAGDRVAEEERRRIMAVLGIREPDALPPAASDPGRPPGLIQRSGSTDWQDEAGNKYVRSPWGGWSNYDESKAGNYTLPDPLTLQNGRLVTTPAMWRDERRPEILRLFETEIYGHPPANTPKVTFQVIYLDRTTFPDRAIVKKVVGRIGNTRASQPLIDLTLYLPPNATEPLPVVVKVGVFYRLDPGALPPQISQTLAAGWAFATVNTSALQDDGGGGLRRGIIGLVAQGQPRALDDWGVLAAWSWGLSRALDYLETDPSVDARRAAVQGHSRFGKTALLAAALDERWAIAWSSGSGAMGTSLEKRNWGETIDNVAALDEYHWMAGNFLKYAGRWDRLPVDAHELIALVAPRPLFITGGTEDQWNDPHGAFLAAIAAEPVYRLLGKRGLGTRNIPTPDLARIDGELAFRMHNGGDTEIPDWPVFIQWAKRYLDKR